MKVNISASSYVLVCGNRYVYVCMYLCLSFALPCSNLISLIRSNDSLQAGRSYRLNHESILRSENISELQAMKHDGCHSSGSSSI